MPPKKHPPTQVKWDQMYAILPYNNREGVSVKTLDQNRDNGHNFKKRKRSDDCLTSLFYLVHYNTEPKNSESFKSIENGY